MDGLRITPASFSDARALERAITKAIKGSNIEIPGSIKEDIKLSGFIDAIASTISSEEVENALFKCAEKAIYKDQRINRDFFEPVENRELFYPIMAEVVKENVGPFMKRIASLFPGVGEAIKGKLQKQK